MVHYFILNFSELQEELEALEAIYIHELEVVKNDRYEINTLTNIQECYSMRVIASGKLEVTLSTKMTLSKIHVLQFYK